MTAPTVLWFRQDLRLRDHPALVAAAAAGPVLPVYILDDDAPGRWRMGGASRWFLHGALEELAAALKERGGFLALRRGKATDILRELAKDVGAASVHFTRRYEPFAVKEEAALRRALDASGVACKRYGGSLLAEPEDIRTGGGEPYKVFSPFWRALRQAAEPEPAKQVPRGLSFAAPIASDDLADWGLLPTKPDWAGGLRETWKSGEEGARSQLKSFLSEALKTYPEDRDRPDRDGTSRLSPYLHFGAISPRECWRAAMARAEEQGGAWDKGAEAFIRELGWRDFSHQLLFHWPDLPTDPWKEEFARFPWRDDAAGFRAWTKGQTGYPIVDAGMRQLWQTGWMHNRVRMMVASFLTKHMLIPWRKGADWFWDCLVDADLANNSASWQWVAGSGADAAPYFRVFNPVLQGKKFDPDGTYVRRFVPELEKLPSAHVHAPWEAPADMLEEAGIVLGDTYPKPIVDLMAGRDRALAAYERIKAS
jgi:deoxyribodipyrimidine photo-lyase